MKTFRSAPALRLTLGQARLSFGAPWLLLAPLGLLGIAYGWVALTRPFGAWYELWAVAALTALVGLLSIVAHGLAHALVARRLGCQLPPSVPLYPFGDAAQAWPAGPTALREALVALAGPLANLLLAGLGWLLWESQLLPGLDAAALFLLYFNLLLAVVNLAPGFPLDGGRLARALLWGLAGRPERGQALARWVGRLGGALLALWGLALALQGARFGLETGLGTVAAAGLLLLGLQLHPQPAWPGPTTPAARHPAGAALAGAILLAQLGAALSLTPRVEGLYAPGTALPVEPMIYVAPDRRYQHEGEFLLTTVMLQTPILTGQWVYGLFSPAVQIVPPERIVPPEVTPQEQIESNARLLEESQSVAAVVGLRLAGYNAGIASTAAEVIALTPDSAAVGLLQPGDQIVALERAPVRSTADLLAELARNGERKQVQVLVERDGQQLSLAVPLLPPAAPDGPPRIGIRVQSVGFVVDLPFEVRITPRKIGGGPSAGLMFALAVYNAVTPEDLTGGRRIAGTGTVAADGTVGPIGGVAQKVVAAERAGAEYFLVPPGNYDDALRAAGRITVVQVATAQEALAFLQSLNRGSEVGGQALGGMKR